MNPEIEEALKNTPVLIQNKQFILELEDFLNIRIETNNPKNLREQIADASAFMQFLDKLIAKAEAVYRIRQKEAAENAPNNLKSDSRKAYLDGECAPERYARDYFTLLSESLNSRISSSKQFLISLNEELKRVP